MDKEKKIELKKIFSERLDSAMRKNGYETDSAFLDFIDIQISQPRFSQLKNAKLTTLPSAVELTILSQGLGVSIDYLLGRDEQSVKKNNLDGVSQADMFDFILNMMENDIVVLRTHVSFDSDTYSYYQNDSVDLCLNYCALNNALFRWLRLAETYLMDENKDLLPSDFVEYATNSLRKDIHAEEILSNDDLPFSYNVRHIKDDSLLLSDYSKMVNCPPTPFN